MTSGAIFWRLFWKEYRTQRALWLSVAGLTAILLLLIAVVSLSSDDRAAAMFAVATTLPVFYGLGCVAVSFAGEHESQTFEFLRSLPVGSRQVVAAKCAFALASIALMLGLMWAAAIALSGRTPIGLSENDPFAAVPMKVGVLGVAMFLWALYFSLRLRRVAMAAVLGVAVASVHAALLTMAGRTVPAALVAAVVIAADLWLAAHWFGKPAQRALPRGWSIAARASHEASARAWVLRPEWPTLLARLIWQHVRHARGLMAVLTLLIVVLALFPAGLLVAKIIPFADNSNLIDGRPLYVLALALVPLLAACAFMPDQWGRSYRFLADRGAPPRLVWLSRQIVALAAVALVLPVLLYVAYWLSPERNYLSEGELGPHCNDTLLYVAGFVILGYAVGQCCALFIRSNILAGLFAVLAAAVLAGWWGLMFLWQVPWFWSVAPIPLALLIATWLRVPHWLLERNSLRGWFLPALVVALPLAAIALAAPQYRVAQIPYFGPAFPVADFARPMTADERATLELYEQAMLSLRQANSEVDQRNAAKPLAADRVYRLPDGGPNMTAERIAAQRETIALALRASRGELFDPLLTLPQPDGLLALARLLVFAARESEDRGRLDEGREQYFAAIRIVGQYRAWYEIYSNTGWDPNNIEWDVYASLPGWAARPNQTPARIRAAQSELRELSRKAASVFPELQPQYILLRRILAGDAAAMSFAKHPLPVSTLLWMQLPWERERAQRLLDFMTRAAMEMPIDSVPGDSDASDIAYFGWNAQVIRFDLTDTRDGELLFALRRRLNLPPMSDAWLTKYDWSRPTLLDRHTAIATARNASQVVLALQAWRLEHGVLPESLGDMGPSIVEQLPYDPHSFEPFRYFPVGLPTQLDWSQPQWLGVDNGDHRGDVPAHTPFIWSTGARVRSYQPSGGESGQPERFRITHGWPVDRGNSRFSYYSPNTQTEVWAAGWPFPIPAAETESASTAAAPEATAPSDAAPIDAAPPDEAPGTTAPSAAPAEDSSPAEVNSADAQHAAAASGAAATTAAAP